MENKFYVYGLVGPRTNIIKYIGKGSNNRMFDHVKYAKRNNVQDRNYTKLSQLKEILNTYEDIAYIKLFETDNEQKTFNVEKNLISKYYTLIPGGWNLTLGQGGTSGRRCSKETREKMSKNRKGKHLSEEAKKKISEFHKGKSLSEEHKQKISKSRKGIIFTEEHKLNLSKAHIGKPNRRAGIPNPHPGFPRSEECRKKISEFQKGRKRGKYKPRIKKKENEKDKSNSNRFLEKNGIL